MPRQKSVYFCFADHRRAAAPQRLLPPVQPQPSILGRPPSVSQAPLRPCIDPTATTSRPLSHNTVLPRGKIKTRDAKDDLGRFNAPKRPDHGSLGQTIYVRANDFLIDPKDFATIYQYKVSIRSEKETEHISKGLARVIEKAYVQKCAEKLQGRSPLFDGSQTMYTAGPLPFHSDECIIELPSSDFAKKGRAFTMRIELVGSRHRSALVKGLKECPVPQDILRALAIALREHPSQHLTTLGKYFFSKAFGNTSLSRSMLTGWGGFSQTVRPTQQGLVLSVDLSATAFYESVSVLDYLKQEVPGFNHGRELSPSQLESVKKAVTGLWVRVTHHDSRRKYRVAGLSELKTEELGFKYGEGEEAVDKAIVDYFKETYNFPLRWVKLPCLQVRASRTTYLPMEVCKISEGQKYRGKMTEADKRCLRKLTNLEPRKREEIIRNVMHHDYGPAQGKFVREFGIRVTRELTTVRARHLPPPTLKYGQIGGSVKLITPESDAGKWNLMEGAQVVEGCRIAHWTIVNFDKTNFSPGDMSAFASKLRARCMDLGVWMSEGTMVDRYSRSPEHLKSPKLERLLQTIKGEMKNIRLQLLVCVMGEKNSSYGNLKKYCEIDLGIVTQCCLTENLKKSSSQILANLVLKINSKLGGLNVELARGIPEVSRVLDTPTIFFGADVSHPQAGDDQGPSIAAVLASWEWPSPSRYASRVRLQASREEIIHDLGDMVKELWKNFYDKTKLVPERVVFFRDGVGDGQFKAVLMEELKVLRQALTEVGGFCKDYKPRITIAVVQKRHSTRLFPAYDDGNRRSSSAANDDRNQGITPSASVDGKHRRSPSTKSKNILPGTVVDTKITHPREFDFYLCSHAGVRGTSKPAHYHVLWDENNFRSDDLQILVYQLCYTFARCTRSVSIVPPAYYAHLAAYRARLYLQFRHPPPSSSSNSASNLLANIPYLPNLHRDLLDAGMIYN